LRALRISLILAIGKSKEEPLVRVVEVDLLGKDARALHLRDQRDALKCPLDQVGEVVELTVRVPVAGHLREAVPCRLRIPDQDRAPRVRMNVGKL